MRNACSSFAVGKACKAGAFTCPNGECISPGWVLDGDDDCKDGSDEGKVKDMEEEGFLNIPLFLVY